MATIVPASGLQAAAFYNWPTQTDPENTALQGKFFPFFSEKLQVELDDKFHHQQASYYGGGWGPSRREATRQWVKGGLSFPMPMGTAFGRILQSYCPFHVLSTLTGGNWTHSFYLIKMPWPIQRMNNLHIFRGPTVAAGNFTYRGFFADSLVLTQKPQRVAEVSLRGYGHHEENTTHDSVWLTDIDRGYCYYDQFELYIGGVEVNCSDFKAQINFGTKPHFPDGRTRWDRVIPTGSSSVKVSWAWEEDDENYAQHDDWINGTAKSLTATWYGDLTGHSGQKYRVRLIINPLYYTSAAPAIAGERIVSAQRQMVGIHDPDADYCAEPAIFNIQITETEALA